MADNVTIDTTGTLDRDVELALDQVTRGGVLEDEQIVKIGLGAEGGLASSTTFYVRAFAHNSVGYSYGAEVTFDTLAASGGAPRLLMMGVG
jgi:hypothetical protein